jgi:crotonobetainyl-CoA:carnitine CoA-transferase CaiB-like acyl-CoA transferase
VIAGFMPNGALAMQAGFFLRAPKPASLAAETGIVPYQVFAAAEGWMFLSVDTHAQWVQLCQTIG